MQADEISVLDGVIVARVQSADFDEDKSRALLQQILATIEATPAAPVVLNLSKTTVMPSMSIGALVTLWKKLQDGHQRFILVGLLPPVRNTLAVCRLDKLFEFSDSEEEARTRVRPAAS